MSTKSTGLTAMKNARKWIALRYPEGTPVLEAGKSLKSFFRDGERITLTVREDLFGVIDIAIFPRRRGFVEFIQVTSINAAGSLSAVNTRKKKVGDWLKIVFNRRQPLWLGPTFVIGWVQRKHFRVWEWDWDLLDWIEGDPQPVKLPKPDRKRAAAAAQKAPPLQVAEIFD